MLIIIIVRREEQTQTASAAGVNEDTSCLDKTTAVHNTSYALSNKPQSQGPLQFTPSLSDEDDGMFSIRNQFSF